MNFFKNSVSTSISLTISLILPSFHFVLSQIDSGTSTHLIGINLNKMGIICQYIGK